MNINEIIRKRKSCRTYSQAALKAADKRELESFIFENNKGLENEVVNFKIIEKGSIHNQTKLNLGNFKGHNNYILGTVKSTMASRVNYGYLMEKIVLKATEMSISTCWVGHFDYSFFDEISIEEGFDIPGIVIFGYSEEKLIVLKSYVKLFFNVQKRHNWDKLFFSQEQLIVLKSIVKLFFNVQKRHNWDKLFFSHLSKTPLKPKHIKKYSESLEMVRLAPSSGNLQPWRVFFNVTTNEFHFFKKSISKHYELRGLHDIEMGIALSHFELASVDNGLSGCWYKHTNEDISSIDDLQYVITWKCE